jgi:hypothetical protein
MKLSNGKSNQKQIDNSSNRESESRRNKKVRIQIRKFPRIHSSNRKPVSQKINKNCDEEENDIDDSKFFLMESIP